MDWIQQWQSKLNKQNGVAPLVRTGGSRHTGLAALPHRNIHIAQVTTLGYLNPPSKASGIAVALFQKYQDIFVFHTKKEWRLLVIGTTTP